MPNFKHISKAEWLSKIEKDLKGKPIESLNWEFSNFELGPIYTPEDIIPSPPISKNSQWEIGHVIVCGTDYKRANTQAITALNHGANAIIFDFSFSVSRAELSDLLKEIQLEWISVHFQLNEEHDIEHFARAFYNHCKEMKFEPSKINSTIRTHVAITDTDLGTMIKANISPVFIYYPGDSTAIVESLSFMLEQGSNAMGWLIKNDIDVENCNKKIHFALEVSDNYFMNIAMLRAFRLLWQNILKSWGVANIFHLNLEVHVSTLNQVADQNTNKIKAGTQALSAAIGGSSRIVIHPTIEEDSVFSDRIALNVHHILQSEAYIGQVNDPSAGSYYIEHLTNKICELTWEAFQNNHL